LPLNTRRNNWLAWSVGVCVLGGACSTPKEKQPAAPAVATTHGLTAEQAALPLVKVADETVTLGEFAATIADKNPYLRARYTSPERRRELLDELVKFELLAREAKARGLDKLPEVERARRQVMVQQMMKAEFEDKVKASDVTDAEVQAYYDAHPDEFHKPAQVRASQIVVKDEAKAKKLLKQVLDKRDDNELFRELARSQSEDKESALRDGDLAFFSLPKDRIAGDVTVPDAVAEAAFQLANVGDVGAALVKSGQGFHIVKLTGRRKALDRSLEQAHRTIQNKLWREKREARVAEFMKQLRDEAKIEEHWELLSEVQIAADADAGTPKPGVARGAKGKLVGARGEP
jgi:peptidyl-prolyl cis-trans isomerase C